jgi:hypothetical protein
VDSVRTIARTVLYEGYLLWPYRRSALKNQHRFTLGGLYPEAYARQASDRARSRFDVLLEGAGASVDVELRFLRMLRRQVLHDGAAVDETTAAGTRYLTWDEATEEAIDFHALADMPVIREIVLDRRSDDERIDEHVTLRRSAEALHGRVTVAAEQLAPALCRLTVDVANTAPWDGTVRDEALRRTLLACHVVLRARGGAFVSVQDPPERLRAETERCRAEGLWPVLVGEEPDRTTVLASPMILEDYPRVAPESPGDHFDGGEIDELLVHTLRALTDEEHREIRETDPRARELLDRALSLSPRELARLHGAVRESHPVER